MKIACLSYYSDFTRYFASLASSSNDVEIKNYCVNLSAYLYKGSPLVHSVFLPVAVRKRGKEVHIDNESIDWFTEYPRRMGISGVSISRIAKRYFTYFYTSLNEEKPDIVIVSGDTRLQSRTMSLAAQRLRLPCLYFEQGPNSTTILDPKGVNATASFALRDLELTNDQVTS